MYSFVYSISCNNVSSELKKINTKLKQLIFFNSYSKWIIILVLPSLSNFKNKKLTNNILGDLYTSASNVLAMSQLSERLRKYRKKIMF